MLRKLEAVEQSGDSIESRLDVELRRERFRWAAHRVRDEFTEPTWTAFWETMVIGRPVAEVAQQLGRSVGAVYTARSRIVQRIKEEVDQFDWQIRVDR